MFSPADGPDMPSEDKANLLSIIRTDLDESVSFGNGVDGYPAFTFKGPSDRNAPAEAYISTTLVDFSIWLVMRPTQGGFVFAVVNPAGNVVQFGVEITDPESGLMDIMLYLPDEDSSGQAQSVLLTFTVPSFMEDWTRVALQVKGDEIALYLDCELYEKMAYVRKSPGIEFESGSTLQLAQAGPTFDGQYQVWS